MQSLHSSPLINLLDCQYAFYFHRSGQEPFFQANCDRFPSASIIKVPLLLAWAHLERVGEVSQEEICCLDDEPQVQGAGFSWLFHTRQLTYHDVLLMMIALSDNLCTNLVIRRMGLDRISQVFSDTLGLKGTRLQRKLMDLAARERGLDNWITAADCIHCFELIRQLSPEERNWVEPVLLSNQDAALLMRDIPRDTVDFYHKTGSLTGLFHDWGYTRDCEIFLLTNQVKDELALYSIFGKLGRLILNET